MPNNFIFQVEIDATQSVKDGLDTVIVLLFSAVVQYSPMPGSGQDQMIYQDTH